MWTVSAMSWEHSGQVGEPVRSRQQAMLVAATQIVKDRTTHLVEVTNGTQYHRLRKDAGGWTIDGRPFALPVAPSDISDSKETGGDWTVKTSSYRGTRVRSRNMTETEALLKAAAEILIEPTTHLIEVTQKGGSHGHRMYKDTSRGAWQHMKPYPGGTATYHIPREGVG